jgi:TPP-dependent pyruvate/acetoin dehydrogenase alpha subunit
MDVRAVAAASAKAIDHVRSGKGPYFLECLTYRFRAHSMFDAELYRDKAEVEDWKHRDPIALLRGALEAEGILAPGTCDEMEREVAQAISEAVAAAESGHWEPVEELTRDVYTAVAEIAL